jgi:hypothetical protein
MIQAPKRKGLARQYPIDLIVERQLEEVTAFLNQRMETDKLYLWQVVDTNPDRDEFSISLVQNGRRSAQAWFLLRRWEGVHTRITGSMNYRTLRIRQPIWWALYIPPCILLISGLLAAITAVAAIPLVVFGLSLAILASPFGLYPVFAVLSEYVETRQLTRTLRDYLLTGLRQ